MSRFYKRIRKRAGLSPGTLLPPEERKVTKVRLSLFDYDERRFEEKELQTVEEAFPFKEKPTVTWLNIEGLHELDILEKIGRNFNIHLLVLEDIASAGQRPKVENHDDYLYIVLRMLDYDQERKTIQGEQLSIILGSNFVILFQEREGDIFNVIRERLRNNESRIRKSPADYLAYRLLDTVVDYYFVILEKLGEDIEEVEEQVMGDPSEDILHDIHRLKRELIYLRKSVWPLREVINGLIREDTRLIQDTTDVFFKDVYDHTIQVIDTVESFRDMVSGTMDVYLSSVSNKMNEVMKILTIMASIFIPLTFIAGIYGMNFNPEVSPWNMPELNWSLGYPFTLSLMLVMAFGLIFYFKKKKWL
ncbi:magnesium/cobalt transporter CorA [candidate division KSB1 bacterium]|nr:magnesium/cobalt transporter CorA [candidate division KSB1 bacterium]NIR70635.1 magnesium/cobalt transporter CorA [candidate division KSB1 bacterium]NIS27738.1 magnesium/cobalt transporter CorA [candidate division KSB1 bacterium]NIT74573.1 magnesium/cobalt transporter CorA [candidate division KSB1 bacterium]NIU28405.1 magnesium/cobalt transporter CorA [candidate division KSB1 bacterium]